MTTEDLPRVELADAEEADFIAIAGRYCPESLLRDYFRLAKQSTLRCLTLRCAGQIIGFGLLVFRRPEFWPAADYLGRLPEVVGLSINPGLRRRGYGSAFMRGIELETAKAGYSRLYLTVDPIENPAAYAFYRHLDYQQLQTEPYHAVWEMKDSHQRVYRGENWLIDMFKDF